MPHQPYFEQSSKLCQCSWRIAASDCLCRSITVLYVRLTHSSWLPYTASKHELCNYRGNQVICIYCQNDTKVVNSRHQKKLNRVWRRRTCLNCGATFTSSEAIDLSGSITVKDIKRLEPFQRDKLFMSIFDSLKHRKTALSDATGLTDTVITQLYRDMQEAVIDKSLIIRVVTTVLQRFDKPAAVYYSAFHPDSTHTGR